MLPTTVQNLLFSLVLCKKLNIMQFCFCFCFLKALYSQMKTKEEPRKLRNQICILRQLFLINTNKKGTWFVEMSVAYIILGRKPEGKRSLGRRIYERVILKCILNGGERVYTWFVWLGIIVNWRAVVNVVMNLRIPQSGGNFLTVGRVISFSKKWSDS
jgi:hypothetical protein